MAMVAGGGRPPDRSPPKEKPTKDDSQPYWEQDEDEEEEEDVRCLCRECHEYFIKRGDPDYIRKREYQRLFRCRDCTKKSWNARLERARLEQSNVRRQSSGASNASYAPDSLQSGSQIRHSVSGTAGTRPKSGGRSAGVGGQKKKQSPKLSAGIRSSLPSSLALLPEMAVAPCDTPPSSSTSGSEEEEPGQCSFLNPLGRDSARYQRLPAEEGEVKKKKKKKKKDH